MDPQLHLISIFPSFQALFTDIDGTAVDSEPIIRKVIENMAEEAEIIITPDDWSILGGLGDKGVWKNLTNRSNHFLSVYKSGEAFEKARLERYIERITEVAPHQPVLDLTHHFIAAGKPVWAVTNSPPRIANPHLENAGYPLESMGLVTELDAHEKGLPSKPERGMYSLAFYQAALGNLSPGDTKILRRENCLVLEDSPNGTRAGLREEMVTVQLIDLSPPLAAEEVVDLTSGHPERYFPMTLAQFEQVVNTITGYTPK